MNGYCSSCGGMIGRDCFNPQECAEITAQMEHQAVKSSAYDDGFAAGKASLLSVQKQLVEALTDCKWLFEQDELKPLMSGRWGDPAVVADKVNLAILAAKASS